jgi:uncharacterized protein YaiI (UPF0178 family)
MHVLEYFNPHAPLLELVRIFLHKGENAMSNENTPSKSAIPALPSMWKQSTQGAKNVDAARQMLQLKHGMFASVPIICKGRTCPYFQTCWIPEADLQVGERCPIEIGAILERFDKYCQQLNIDTENEIVDAGLVKEVVDIEIMMVRADGLLARDGNLIEEVVAGVSPKGQEYYRPEIHLAVELKERLRKEKTRILNQLNATRKDKKNDGLVSNDPSSVAARIIAKVRDLQAKGSIIDVTPNEEIHTEDTTKEVDNDGMV